MPFDGEKLEMPVRDVMLAAADLIRRHGLAKYDRQDAAGGLCLHGALAMAEDGKLWREGPLHCAASFRVYRYLISQGLDDVGIAPPHRHAQCIGCAAWNNKDGRTADEVIAVLENAAAFVSA